MEDALQNFIRFAENSFSVVVAGYLLLRMETRLEALTKAIAELRGLLTPTD